MLRRFGMRMQAQAAAPLAASVSGGEEATALPSQELQSLAAHQVLFHRLRAGEQAVMTKTSFNNLCFACGVDPTAENIAALDAAGVIVNLRNCYYIKPTKLLENASAVIAAESFDPLHQLNAELSKLQSERAPLEMAIQHACDEAAKTRKIMWGGAMTFAGAQLAVVSRLTYFDLDWDIMEPSSYFLGTGTALVFYVWMLRYKTEHSYESCDKRLVNNKVRKVLEAQNFDFQRYEDLNVMISDTKEKLIETDEWFRKN